MTPQEIVIPVDSQKLADELKSICIKYGLPIWDNECAFEYREDKCYFRHGSLEDDFYVSEFHFNKTQITKEQFIELLDNIKK